MKQLSQLCTRSSACYATAALLAAATLTGCGDVAADEAAVIDGRVITDVELQQATAQLNSTAAQPSTPAAVLSEVTRGPLLDDVLGGTPIELTDGQVSDFLKSNGLQDPLDLTIDVARSRQYLITLQDPQNQSDPQMEDALAELQEISVADFEDLNLKINPRYGSFDPETASIIPDDPEWITPAG